jgi:flagellar biosynthetic protein FlhB
MAGERTEKPTPKRRREARRKGQVAKSSDVVEWSSVLVGSYLLPDVVRRLAASTTTSLFEMRRMAADPSGAAAVSALGEALRRGFVAAVPLMAVVMVVSIVASVAQTGLLLTTKPLVPDFKRLNPLAGIRRLFSRQSLWTTCKQLIRMTVVTVLAIPRIRATVTALAGRGRVGLNDSLMVLADGLVGLVRIVAFWMLVLGLADYGFQRSQHVRRLRMTKQEVREELRQSEGDAMVKGRIRALQRAVSRNRMMANLHTASVVITNPTHIAVALRYDAASSPAPRVVAVGAGSLAARIRDGALAAKVPIVEAKPLARALWRACDVGDEIPATLYEAVAKVLAFVHRLDRRFGVGRPVELPSALRVADATLDAVGRRRRGRGTPGQRRTRRPAAARAAVETG